MKTFEEILTKHVKGVIPRDYTNEDLDYYTVKLSTVLKVMKEAHDQAVELSREHFKLILDDSPPVEWVNEGEAVPFACKGVGFGQIVYVTPKSVDKVKDMLK